MNRAKEILCFSFVVFLGLNGSCAGEDSLQDYKDLKPISFFGAISVSVYIGNPADTAIPAKWDGLSSAELTQFMRFQFAKYFSGVPFRDVDVTHWSNEENRRVMGRFLCRVWIADDDLFVVYQVKCQISTSDHSNIVGNAIIGYCPKDKVAAVVSQHIDRMVESFAPIYFRVRNEL